MEPIRVKVISADEHKVVLKRMAEKVEDDFGRCVHCGGKVLPTIPMICADCGKTQDGARY